MTTSLGTSAGAEAYYLYVTGQHSGKIAGGVVQLGREGSVLVSNVAHGIVSPRDIQSGLPSGQRQHEAFEVTIGMDKSLPIFYNCLCTNENLPLVELKYWIVQDQVLSRPGTESQEFTVKLINASLASIRQSVEKDSVGAKHTLFKLAFTYQKIEWSFGNGAATALDDWEARV